MKFGRKFVALMLTLVIAGASYASLVNNAVLADELPPMTITLKAAGALDYSQVSGYVNQMYSTLLGRSPDQDGLNYWASKIYNHEMTGAAVGYSFAKSAEFVNGQGSTNDGFINALYAAFFGRTPADSEVSYWLQAINGGQSKDQVLAFFLSSNEFNTICDGYGIVAGTCTVGRNMSQESNTNLFVYRLYTTILRRTPDREGLSYWTTELMSSRQSGASAGYSFIFSDEYRAQNKSDLQFVTDLYEGFYGRTPDQGGLNYWTNLLASPNVGDMYYDDIEIFAGFVNSTEFGSICATYGIPRGAVSVANYRNARPNREFYYDEDYRKVPKDNGVYLTSNSLISRVSSFSWVGAYDGNVYDPNTKVNLTFQMNRRQSNPITIRAWIYRFDRVVNGEYYYTFVQYVDSTYDPATGAVSINTNRTYGLGTYVITLGVGEICDDYVQARKEPMLGGATFVVRDPNLEK